VKSGGYPRGGICVGRGGLCGGKKGGLVQTEKNSVQCQEEVGRRTEKKREKHLSRQSDRGICTSRKKKDSMQHSRKEKGQLLF